MLNIMTDAVDNTNILLIFAPKTSSLVNVKRQAPNPCQCLLGSINGVQRRANIAHWLHLEFAFDINFRAWEETSGGLGRRRHFRLYGGK